jgi:hypothetical protein
MGAEGGGVGEVHETCALNTWHQFFLHFFTGSNATRGVFRKEKVHGLIIKFVAVTSVAEPEPHQFSCHFLIFFKFTFPYWGAGGVNEIRKPLQKGSITSLFKTSNITGYQVRKAPSINSQKFLDLFAISRGL